MGGAAQGKARWSGSDWGANTTRRITVGFDAITKRTGYYTDTLQIVRYTGNVASPATTVAGELKIVNRSGRTADSAYFGRGWWLAGLEQLYNLSDGTKLWVGGDGSMRHFLKIPGISNVWTTTLVDGTDGLNFDGVNYTRFLPHGLKVRFDGTGKHIATINRLGDSTIFRYDAANRLASIKLYPDTTRQYVFQYDANGKLAVVLGPSVGSTARNDTVTIASGLLTRIKGPDTTHVDFTYVAGDTNLIATRADRNAVVSTYAFGAGKKLKSYSVNPGFDASQILVHFDAFEAAGTPLAGSTRIHALSADSAFTLLDGPRRDTTRFWPNRLGEPNRVRDALGNLTAVRRDGTWPGLVAWIRDPAGRAHSATYDNHGNPLTVIDSSNYDPIRAKYAVTTYAWDQLWDFMKRVKRPEGEGQLRSYSTTTGNMLWEQPDSDSTVTTRRTSFLYGTSGSAKNLLVSTIEPLTPGDSIVYDLLGNVSALRSARGHWSMTESDNVGRAYHVQTPIDSSDRSFGLQAGRQDKTVTYDVRDNAVTVVTTGPAMSGAAAQTLTVQTDYDRNANPHVVRRTQSPNPTSLATLTTRREYDNVGRLVLDVATDGKSDSISYDASGNAVRQQNRLGQVTNLTYDLLNRLSTRSYPAVVYAKRTDGVTDTLGQHQPIQPGFPRWPSNAAGGYTIPADADTLTYDALSHLTEADNAYAKVSRTYYLSGALAAETQRVRTVAPLDSGGNFSSHVYVAQYVYDLDLRRTSVTHPAQLSGRPGMPLTDRYGFDPVTGELTSVTDVIGNHYSMAYTPRGELNTLTRPGAVVETRTYDPDGDLATFGMTSGSVAWFRHPSPTVRSTTLVYDAAGRMLGSHDPNGFVDTPDSIGRRNTC